MPGKAAKPPKAGQPKLPPIDPAKRDKCLEQLREIEQGKGEARAGKWRIVQAYKVIESEQLYLHYERQVGGKSVRYTAPAKFAQGALDIKPRTLYRWLECAKAFNRDVFLKHGTTKLSAFLTLAPLVNISPIPADPSDISISIPGKGKKPAAQKKFADCSKEELAQALRALKGAPPSKLPEAVGIVLAEATAAYRQAAGPQAPDLLKLRQAKDGTIEMSLSPWLPLSRESVTAYAALLKGLSAAVDRHPETIAAHAPAAPTPSAPPTPDRATQLKRELAKMEQEFGSLLSALGPQLEPTTSLYAELMAALKSEDVPTANLANRLQQLRPLLPPDKRDAVNPAVDLVRKHGEMRKQIEKLSRPRGTGEGQPSAALVG